MRFMTAKPIKLLGIEPEHRIRVILLRESSTLMNQILRLLRELRLAISRSPHAFETAMPDARERRRADFALLKATSISASAFLGLPG
ncbi:hypothetical protein [Burkholderia sp. SCN-KJ]|uniref:hypothetical protein n=1 Tax=Burkholderia sp. SCN-KJ TaxID=2969248 RepID=UPI00214F9208|nr:hypothetical protein [Burkholderia sp. SCN-KJ]MCR4470459.1 hypothetical protein [Burkholderia sp. SCN-KJ]